MVRNIQSDRNASSQEKLKIDLRLILMISWKTFYEGFQIYYRETIKHWLKHEIRTEKTLKVACWIQI